MRRLTGEALLITGGLEKAVFVGAVAAHVYARIKRGSGCTGFAVEGGILAVPKYEQA